MKSTKSLARLSVMYVVYAGDFCDSMCTLNFLLALSPGTSQGPEASQCVSGQSRQREAGGLWAGQNPPPQL